MAGFLPSPPGMAISTIIIISRNHHNQYHHNHIINYSYCFVIIGDYVLIIPIRSSSSSSPAATSLSLTRTMFSFGNNLLPTGIVWQHLDIAVVSGAVQYAEIPDALNRVVHQGRMSNKFRHMHDIKVRDGG